MWIFLQQEIYLTEYCAANQPRKKTDEIGAR
jgi:hypothetical protein